MDDGDKREREREGRERQLSVSTGSPEGGLQGSGRFNSDSVQKWLIAI